MQELIDHIREVYEINYVSNPIKLKEYKRNTYIVNINTKCKKETSKVK